MTPRRTQEVDRRPKSLSLRDAANYSGMSVDTLRRLVVGGRIAGVRSGTKILVLRESLDLHIDSLPSV